MNLVRIKLCGIEVFNLVDLERGGLLGEEDAW